MRTASAATIGTGVGTKEALGMPTLFHRLLNIRHALQKAVVFNNFTQQCIVVETHGNVSLALVVMRGSFGSNSGIP